MGYLSEDPTYLAGGLGLLAVAMLVALQITQQGQYLIRALVALGLAAVVLVVEHLWVTDSERIEQVVYGLRDAVANSDGERVMTYLTPDVEIVQGGSQSSGQAAQGYIKAAVANAKFDFLRISRLKAQAFPQSRRGVAEFRVLASGSVHFGTVQLNFGTTNSDWSLGFTEASPQVWKVDRITPTQLSEEVPGPSGSGSGSRRVRPMFRLPR
jgi:hypothetical protein